VRGLANPKYFLLNFRDPQVSNLNGQITSRDHDPERHLARASHNQFGQISHRTGRFNLCDDTKSMRVFAQKELA
jgi:hypothetical protein